MIKMNKEQEIDINELRKQIRELLVKEIGEETIFRTLQMVEIARDRGSSKFHKTVLVGALYDELKLKELRLLNKNISVLNSQISILLPTKKKPGRPKKVVNNGTE